MQRAGVSFPPLVNTSDIILVLNLGTFLSGVAGGKLYDLVGYNWLVVISGMATFLCLPLIPWLKVERVNSDA